MFTLLVGIILGLIGVINQEYVKEQWRWYTVTRPYMQAQVRLHVLPSAAEQALKPKDTFREPLRQAQAGTDLHGATSLDGSLLLTATRLVWTELACNRFAEGIYVV